MAILRDQAGAVIEPAASTFEEDILQGLRSVPKYLPSKYFYDETGDKLFQQIMRCPEYYLTRAELEIFREQTPEIAEALSDGREPLDLIELGPGDAIKSVHLLKYLHFLETPFTYYPVDISEHIIDVLQNYLPAKIPGVKIKGMCGEYFEMLKAVSSVSNHRKVVLFLGSSIGNFNRQEAIQFLSFMHAHLDPGDLVLVGFDLKKDPLQILSAYNDSAGFTEQFNLNLLVRINRELDANFNTVLFQHYPTYDPVSGACRSYLVSKKYQTVRIGERLIDFDRHEPIFMELSQKYSIQDTPSLAARSGFRPVEYFFDSRDYFLDVVWKRV